MKSFDEIWEEDYKEYIREKLTKSWHLGWHFDGLLEMCKDAFESGFSEGILWQFEQARKQEGERNERRGCV